MAPSDDDRRFRWLLRLLPASFREENERELLRIWREESRDAAREQRRGVWRAALKDTLRVAPSEYLSIWWRDVRFAGRGFRKSPAFALTAILTLGLGTGATAAVFSLVNGVLLRPLPWRNPDAVALLWALQPSSERTWLSMPEVEELQRSIPAFEAVEGLTDLRLNLVSATGAYELQALAVSHGFFSLLGVTPALGRDFAADDNTAGAAPVTILSYAFWSSHFGADPSAVGRSLQINGHDYLVVGVLPQSFAMLPASSVLPEHADIWVALEPHLISRDRSVRFLHAVARLKANATFPQAEQELRAYGEHANQAFAGAYANGPWTFIVTPFARDVLKSARTPLVLLFGLVVLVLLMACANVANLLLTRGESRRTELALRAAIGAGPARLAGELMAEALVLAFCGCVVGLAVAAVTPTLLRAIDPSALPRLDEVNIDARVALFMTALIVLTALVFAAVPLIERMRLRASLVEGTTRTAGRSTRAARVGRLLVVLQTALATTVLVTTLFLLQSFVQLHQVELGIRQANLFTARITLLPQSEGRESYAQVFDRITAAVGQARGVTHVGAITQLPLSGAMLGSAFLFEPGDSGRVEADLRGVTPGYFNAAGTPVLLGRAFSAQDTAAAPGVAIVDETFARKLSPDGQVVGRRIRWFRQPDRDLEIVGVVRAVRHRAVGDAPRETVYRPHHQYLRPSMYLAVRTETDAAPATAAVRAAVASVDPNQPVADVATMEVRAARSMSRVRTSLMLAGVLATLALVLGLIGLYGVLSFGVAQRRREFGVRLSIGATPASVRALILREGAMLTLAGAALGAAAAAGVVSVIGAVLYDTSVADWPHYFVGTAFVLLCSLVAFWIPARRASVTNPLVALRSE